MHSFRIHVPLAVTMLLAACGGPSPEMEENLAEDTAAAVTVTGPGRVMSALLSNCPSNLSGVTTSGSCHCPPVTSFGGIYGTGVYTSDSNLCTAAVHSGVITASTGGDVTYTILPGRSAYCKSTQNGVTSYSYSSAWSASYSVGGAELFSPPKQIAYHKYYEHNLLSGNTFIDTTGSACLLAPVTVVYNSANGGELAAFGADGTKSVLDDVWEPNWRYEGIETTYVDCTPVCPL
ncbi:LCCL domain-containing protein [Archangium violaceum]|uniref:LCCL domain-containing protein n=1 Tax=Archangium violaceum TaxID=83451 RepID=UPI002B2C343D|nr:LCCL domain-containing protein [Archangium gephyra]